MAYSIQYINFKKQSGGLRLGPKQKDFYAKISSVAYGKSKEDRIKKIKKYDLDDWDLSPRSNKDVSILINAKTKEVVAGIRGTDVKNKQDLIDDGRILLGLEKTIPRAKQIEKVLYDVKKDVGKGYDLTLTGHSLGGTIAKTISDKLKTPAVVFNRGSSPVNTNSISALWNRIFKRESKVIHYSTIDPISAAAKLYGNEKDKINVLNKTSIHGLDNFIDDKPMTGSGKKINPWIAHVKLYAKTHGVSYRESIKLSKESYKKNKL